MPERFALYYAPAVTHPLWTLAAQWLGRDPAGATTSASDIAGRDSTRRLSLSASARRYGFHATLKAPMLLHSATSREDLEAALLAFGREQRPVRIGRLVLRFIDGFLALVPDEQSEALTDFAAALVQEFDPFRAPLTTDERDRRVAGGRLTARQVELLDRYGYPYVMEQFRFHMTLTDRLDETDRTEMMAAAADWFAVAIEAPLMLDRIALFHEPHAGAAFTRLDDFPLRAEAMADA